MSKKRSAELEYAWKLSLVSSCDTSMQWNVKHDLLDPFKDGNATPCSELHAALQATRTLQQNEDRDQQLKLLQADMTISYCGGTLPKPMTLTQ